MTTSPFPPPPTPPHNNRYTYSISSLGGGKALLFYDGETHRGMYSIPKYVRKAIEAEERIITETTPLYVIGPVNK